MPERLRFRSWSVVGRVSFTDLAACGAYDFLRFQSWNKMCSEVSPPSDDTKTEIPEDSWDTPVFFN